MFLKPHKTSCHHDPGGSVCGKIKSRPHTRRQPGFQDDGTFQVNGSSASGSKGVSYRAAAIFAVHLETLLLRIRRKRRRGRWCRREREEWKSRWETQATSTTATPAVVTSLDGLWFYQCGLPRAVLVQALTFLNARSVAARAAHLRA